MELKARLDEVRKRAKEWNDVLGREAGVVELLGPYLVHRSDDDYAWYMFGDALRVLGRDREAEDALRKALELAPSDYRYAVHARLARLCANTARFAEAEYLFGEACADEEGATLGWLWIMRGANRAKQGNYAGAEMCHRKAVSCKEVDREEAYLNLGYVLRAQRRYDEAIAAFKEALRIDPDYSEARTSLEGLEGISEIVEGMRDLA